jgi:hypothetical protein
MNFEKRHRWRFETPSLMNLGSSHRCCWVRCVVVGTLVQPSARSVKHLAHIMNGRSYPSEERAANGVDGPWHEDC